MTDTDLLFNVVYVPGTIRYLHPFLVSMIETSPINVRAVGNGCDEADVDRLHRLAAQYPGRIEVLGIPPAERSEHGELLNRLCRMDRGRDHFCFLDTDVMAIGDWYPTVMAALGDGAAVSGAHPSWDPDPRAPIDEPGLRGHFAYTHDGQLLGTSYLAIYRRRELDEVMERWSVDFARTTHADLASPVARRLEELGSFSFYDTAKVVNCLLQLEGHQLGYAANAPLLHIGAMSILEYMSCHPWQEWPDPGIAARIPDKCARDTVEIAAAVAALLIEHVDGIVVGRIPPIGDPDLQRWFDDHREVICDNVTRYRRVEE